MSEAAVGGIVATGQYDADVQRVSYQQSDGYGRGAWKSSEAPGQPVSNVTCVQRYG